ncbi:MAG: hypothetical protein AABX38_06545 [Candidatus Micrarchaeota archaeon]
MATSEICLRLDDPFASVVDDLRNSSSEVRSQAARMLGETANPAYLKPLLASLATTTNQVVVELIEPIKETDFRISAQFAIIAIFQKSDSLSDLQEFKLHLLSAKETSKSDKKLKNDSDFLSRVDSLIGFLDQRINLLSSLHTATDTSNLSVLRLRNSRVVHATIFPRAPRLAAIGANK